MTTMNTRLSPDPRDRSYEMSLSGLPSLENCPPFKYWDGGGLSLGNSDACNAWLDWCYATPDIVPPDITSDQLYREAQIVDPWPGDHVGTDLRSAWQALVLRAVVGEPRYLFTLEALLRCVLGRGPVVVATDWYESFDRPDENGTVFMSGPVAGRHAYLIDGANQTDQVFRIRDLNKSRMPFEYMQYLLGHDGEAMIALKP